MKAKSFGFIGGGRITRILLKAFERAGIKTSWISVFDINENVLNSLAVDFKGIEISKDNLIHAASADIVFLAVHPPVLMEVIQAIKGNLRNGSLLVSLAPKITIEKISGSLPGILNIARMNPNAGTYVIKGFNPVCFSNSTEKRIKDEFIKIFEKIGQVPLVKESSIEAYAVVSAMGHTYFWFQLQQLKELALSFGLSDKEANKTIEAMMQGTTDTLFNSGLSYNEVINLVPVKPLAEAENAIKDFYKNYLTAIYQKIKP
jgi:pyrroline-5-carboxylate reductase